MTDFRCPREIKNVLLNDTMSQVNESAGGIGAVLRWESQGRLRKGRSVSFSREVPPPEEMGSLSELS